MHLCIYGADYIQMFEQTTCFIFLFAFNLVIEKHHLEIQGLRECE